jgi:hypothetical protein
MRARAADAIRCEDERERMEVLLGGRVRGDGVRGDVRTRRREWGWGGAMAEEPMRDSTMGLLLVEVWVRVRDVNTTSRGCECAHKDKGEVFPSMGRTRTNEA